MPPPSKGRRLVRSRAPLRVSFGGGGTDVPPYCDERGGAVISATINKYAYATLAPKPGTEATVKSLDYDIVANFHVDDRLEYDGNMDLVKAAMKHFSPPEGFDLFLHSDAPPGSGLGSSSTVMVALIGAFQRWLRQARTDYEVAELAYTMERVDLGIKGGKQDQYASTFGGFNFIEFQKGTTIVNPLKIPRDVLNELEYRTLLVYTGRTRLSANIIQDQVDRFKSGETVEVLDETKRLALEVKRALLRGELWDLGQLLHEGWELKKRFSAKISSAEIDKMYEVARRNGALGGKILGAGGGGFLMLFCEFDRKHVISEEVEKLGGKVVDFGFELSGLQTWDAYERPVP